MKNLVSKSSEWQEIRLRFLLNNYRSDEEINSLKQSKEVTFLPMELVGEHGGLDLSIIRPRSEVESGYTLFFDQDVLIAKITPCFENGKGALARDLFGGIGYGTTELYVLSSGSKLSPEFLFYLTISDDFRIKGEAAMKGAAGQKRVPNEFIQNFRVRLPPLDIQQKISGYLDRETTQIDNLIAAKEQMLTLLEEKREALISHAVTRGLDPNVSFKRSGLDWLGDIPQHWSIRRLKFLIQNLEQGSSPQASNIPAEPDELGILKLSAVYKGEFLRHENKALHQADDAVIHALSLRKGDVLITRGNTPQLVGDVCVVPSNEPNLLLPDLIYRLTIQESKILPEFLSLFLITPQARSQIQSDARGSSGSMVKISQGHILDWRIPVPPKHEQESIIHAIEYEKEKNKELKNALTDSIALLKERRSALITAAVTGQIALKEMR